MAPVLALCALLAAVPSVDEMRGPFPIMSTPYFEKGEVGISESESVLHGTLIDTAPPLGFNILAGGVGIEFLCPEGDCLHSLVE